MNFPLKAEPTHRAQFQGQGGGLVNKEVIRVKVYDANKKFVFETHDEATAQTIIDALDTVRTMQTLFVKK